MVLFAKLFKNAAVSDTCAETAAVETDACVAFAEQSVWIPLAALMSGEK